MMGGLRFQKRGPYRGQFALLENALQPLSASVSALGLLWVEPSVSGEFERRLAESGDVEGEQGRVIPRDPVLLRSRILAWYDTVANLPEVVTDRVAAIGYCFGGSCVLELARSGIPAPAQQPQRQPDDPRPVRQHPFDGVMGLAGVGRPKDRRDP